MIKCTKCRIVEILSTPALDHSMEKYDLTDNL